MPRESIIKKSFLIFLRKNHKGTGYAYLKECKNNNLCVSAGSIYPIIKELINEELIYLEEEGRKKYYYLTESGKKFTESIINDSENDIIDRMNIMIKCDCSKIPDDIKINIKDFFNELNKVEWHEKNSISNFRRELIKFEKIIEKYIERED